MHDSFLIQVYQCVVGLGVAQVSLSCPRARHGHLRSVPADKAGVRLHTMSLAISESLLSRRRCRPGQRGKQASAFSVVSSLLLLLLLEACSAWVPWYDAASSRLPRHGALGAWRLQLEAGRARGARESMHILKAMADGEEGVRRGEGRRLQQVEQPVGRRRSRRATDDRESRRDHVRNGVLLAGLVVVAGSMKPKKAEAISMRMDKEVWTPLEDYMSANENYAQSTYSPKFTAYLARLLINYDYASMSWWERKTQVTATSGQRISRLLAVKGFEGMFEDLDEDGDQVLTKEELLNALNDPEVTKKREQELFAQFQASVNYGLVRYQGKEGVARLFRLLRSEFGLDPAGKRQLALLFSLMDQMQPVEAIKQLIGEAENAQVVGFNVTYGGFGYSKETPPKVTITSSPGFNVSAVASVRLAPTGRLLKVVVDKPMTGFNTVPRLEISPPAQGTRAVCLPKMNGDTIERIVLSNPGSGYTESDRVAVYATVEGQPLPWMLQQAHAVLEMKVDQLVVEDGGRGYAHDLPIDVQIEKPPAPISAVATAKATALLSDPKEGLIRSWLPSTTVSASMRGLLPNNLVPKYDPCLERFFVSPVEELDPNYCIYFEDEFKVVPSQKFNKYFSFLDGPKARSPVEKERDLDASVFWRFALSGAVCCGTAHAFLVPLDVVKTKMQVDPTRYPTVMESIRVILMEGGPQALLIGAGATVIGYLVYGGVSFGLTEYFKRLFFNLAGPEYATLYPFAILLLASMSAAFFGAVAVTPFEALRIRSVAADGYNKGFLSSVLKVAEENQVMDLFAGLGPAVIGEIPFMMAKFAVFDAISKAIYSLFPLAEESVTISLAISLISGMTAGVAAAVVSHPFDTLTTKVTQFSQMRRAGGVLGAIQDIYQKGGVQGFFKGTVPRAFKSAANIAVQFFLYDFLKRALHVSPDDLKLFFDVMSGLEVNPGASIPPQPF